MPRTSYRIRMAGLLLWASMAGLAPAAAQDAPAPERDWMKVSPSKPSDEIVCVDRNSIAKRGDLTYFEAAFCEDVDAGRAEAGLIAFQIDCDNDWNLGGELSLGPVGGEAHTATVGPRENGTLLAKQVCSATAS